jgi:hypothetical protein
MSATTLPRTGQRVALTAAARAVNPDLAGLQGPIVQLGDDLRSAGVRFPPGSHITWIKADWLEVVP